MDMSHARCFPELELQGMDDCNNFFHLLQNDCTTTTTTTTTKTQQLVTASTGNYQHQRPLFCEGSFIKTDSQQLYSSSGEWVMKPKKEEVVLYNDDQLFLSFPFFNWNTPAGRHITSKSRAPHHTTKDHIMVERRRREKIRQRLITLSAILPGLKKMDKASVLENATKYLKQLEERVKVLEQQIKKKESFESVVVVKKSQICNDDDDDTNSHDHELSAGDHDQGLPEIEARISDKSVLIKIHCQKQTSFPQKLLAQVEKLHLIILNISSLSFGNYAMDITISAQMDAEFCLSKKDLIRVLVRSIGFCSDNGT